MNPYIRMILSLIVLLVLSSVKTSNIAAQDPIFSQFNHTPLHINPAFTGQINEKLRTNAAYRDQWRSKLRQSAYTTGFLSFDGNLKAGKNRKVGIGISSIIDRAGIQRSGTNQLMLNTALIQNFGHNNRAYHKVAIGASYGLAKNININDGSYYQDIASGITWSYHGNTGFNIELGSSVYHFNRPIIAVQAANNMRLNMRIGLHAKAEVPLTRTIIAIPSLLSLFQGPTEQYIMGTVVKYNLREQRPSSLVKNIQCGLFARAGNSVGTNREFNSFILKAAIETRNFHVGFSVDHFRRIGSQAYEAVLVHKIGGRTQD